jgi:hypothetical protein
VNTLKEMMDSFHLINMKSYYQVCKESLLDYKIIHKMQNDYLWLSQNDISILDNNYRNSIDKINTSFDLETGTANTDYWKDTSSFQESLFMLQSFLNGSLWCTPNNENFDHDYIQNSHVILTELCKRGVYTISGYEPSVVIRSSHNFIVLINDVVKKEFIQLLKSLYSRGVNVCARQLKRNTVICETIFAIDKGVFIYTDDFQDAIKLPNGFHSPGKNLDDDIEYSTLFSEMIDPSFGMSGLFTSTNKDSCEFNTKEKELSKTHSLFYVETWSQTNDDFRVEDVLFQLWLDFNSKYGHMNDVRH